MTEHATSPHSRHMSPTALPISVLRTMLFISLAACNAEGDHAEDAQAIYGCYAADGAPPFVLSASGMQVVGATSPVRFHYGYAKVGYGIKVPLEASRFNGPASFVPSAGDYFYRRASASEPPVFIVAFGPEVVKYHRSEAKRCHL